MPLRTVLGRRRPRARRSVHRRPGTGRAVAYGYLDRGRERPWGNRDSGGGPGSHRPRAAYRTVNFPHLGRNSGGPEDPNAVQPTGDGRSGLCFLVLAGLKLGDDKIKAGGNFMRSFQVCRCGEPMQFAETATPKPKGTEVVVKTLAAGGCHSDLHIWEGFYDLGHGKALRLQERGVKLPLTMGHENVGEVVAVGPRAKGVKVGDKRLVYPWIGCGTCAVCKRGDEQLCMAPRFLGVYRDGGYATHILVPHPRYLVPYPRVMKPEQAAPLACSGVTAYGALKKLGSLVKSEPVVVFGAGGVGLVCIC